MEQLGKIKDINVGMRDVNGVICWFIVETLNGDSLQIISVKEMEELINKAGVYKLQDLNDRLCIVSIENGLCKFLRLK